VTDWFILTASIGLSVLLIIIFTFKGLKRLDRSACGQIPWLIPITLLGCFTGVLVAGGMHQDFQMVNIITLIMIFLCGLLLAMAYIDFKTCWVPLETQLCLSVGLGIISWSCISPTPLEVLTSGLAGLAALGLTHGLWLLQRRLNTKMIPPVDLMSILAPLALFGANGISLAFYGILFVIVIAVKVVLYKRTFPFVGSLRTMFGRSDYFPALSVLLPLMIVFFIARAWLPVNALEVIYS